MTTRKRRTTEFKLEAVRLLKQSGATGRRAGARAGHPPQSTLQVGRPVERQGAHARLPGLGVAARRGGRSDAGEARAGAGHAGA